MRVRIDEAGHRQLTISINYGPCMRSVNGPDRLDGADAIADHRDIVTGQDIRPFILQLQYLGAANQQIDHELNVPCIPRHLKDYSKCDIPPIKKRQ